MYGVSSELHLILATFANLLRRVSVCVCARRHKVVLSSLSQASTAGLDLSRGVLLHFLPHTSSCPSVCVCEGCVCKNFAHTCFVQINLLSSAATKKVRDCSKESLPRDAFHPVERMFCTRFECTFAKCKAFWLQTGVRDHRLILAIFRLPNVELRHGSVLYIVSVLTKPKKGARKENWQTLA